MIARASNIKRVDDCDTDPVEPNANDTSQVIQLALSSHAAAKALDISERTLWTLAKAGKIRSFRIGNARRYHVRELERFIEERTTD